MTQVHSSEGGHWYSRTGEPVYQVQRADGKGLRDTTIRDAKKLGLVPSVTGIIRCASAEGLERWKREQMMLAALTLPRLPDEPEAAFLKRVEQDSRETARKAAERGTAIHAAIQGHFEGEVPPMEYWNHIHPVVSALGDWHGEGEFHGWTVERSFASQLGFGGKVDIHTKGLVADFKTKEFDENADLSTYDEHAMQLAAYRHGLEMPTARCAIVYVSVTVPGLCKLIEIPEAELQRGWRCFYSLLQFWKARTGYESSFEKELAA